MYSLLSLLVQGKVGEMREAKANDEPLSPMPHFMGYFSAEPPPQNLKTGQSLM